MELSNYLNYIACYKGINRSRLFVSALIDYEFRNPPGIPVELFPGGMQRMRSLSIEELQTELHPLGLITLIHDRFDNLDAFTAWQECQSVLKRA